MIDHNSSLTIKKTPDHLVLEPSQAGSIGIAAVRQLKFWAERKPFSSQTKVKIALIQSAEKLTVEAQNAMLKLLEEPPEKTAVILIADNVQNLLPTVRSRCQKTDINHLKKLIPYPNSQSLTFISTLNSQLSTLPLSIPPSLPERFQLAGELSQKSREELVETLNQLMFNLRKKLHQHLKKNSYSFANNQRATSGKNDTFDKVTGRIKKIQKTQKSIRANANLRLSLENLLMEW